jgi:hypothetical protein
MPHGAVFQLVVYFSVVGAIFSLLVAGVIKFFERSLTFGQSFLLAAVTNFVILGVLVVCYAAKAQLGIPRDVDMLATLASMIVMAIMITRLSANYGIKKVGWFGLGAKVVFGLFVLSWVFTAAMFLLIYLFGH